MRIHRLWIRPYLIPPSTRGASRSGRASRRRGARGAGPVASRPAGASSGEGETSVAAASRSLLTAWRVHIDDLPPRAARKPKLVFPHTMAAFSVQGAQLYPAGLPQAVTTNIPVSRLFVCELGAPPPFPAEGMPFRQKQRCRPTFPIPTSLGSSAMAS